MLIRFEDKVFNGLKFRCKPCDGNFKESLLDPNKFEERMHMRLTQALVSRFFSVSFLGIAFIINFLFHIVPFTAALILCSVVLWIGYKAFYNRLKKIYCLRQNLLESSEYK